MRKLRGPQIIGVRWGSTIWHLIEAISEMPGSRRTSAPVSPELKGALPLGCELSVSKARSDYGSTDLAHALERALLNRDCQPRPAVTSLPAYLPYQLTLSAKPLSTDFAAVRAAPVPEAAGPVFGGQDSEGMVNQMDVALVSVSEFRKPFGRRIEQLRLAARMGEEYSVDPSWATSRGSHQQRYLEVGLADQWTGKCHPARGDCS